MKRLWSWLKELWAAPHGRCRKHGEPLERVFHFSEKRCWSCYEEEVHRRESASSLLR